MGALRALALQQGRYCKFTKKCPRYRHCLEFPHLILANPPFYVCALANIGQIGLLYACAQNLQRCGIIFNVDRARPNFTKEEIS